MTQETEYWVPPKGHCVFCGWHLDTFNWTCDNALAHMRTQQMPYPRPPLLHICGTCGRESWLTWEGERSRCVSCNGMITKRDGVRYHFPGDPE